MTTKMNRYEIIFWTYPARPDEIGAVVEIDLMPRTTTPHRHCEFVNARTEWEARRMLGIMWGVHPDGDELSIQSVRCIAGPREVSQRRK